MIAALAALLVQATSPSTDALDAAVVALHACVERETVALEPSGEAANLIAAGVLQACQAERQAAKREVGTMLRVPTSDPSVDGVMQTLDGEVRSGVVLDVLQIRARAKAVE